MFDLPEAWVWDFWVADDGTDYHLFFLYASRALKDPDARHYRASVGHAVSSDLTNWTRVTDALVRSDAPAFDELATWTGSVTKGDDGLWYLLYTGARLDASGKNVQSIGLATSSDLYDWTKLPGPIAEADPRWYETRPDALWHDQAFRDPWVLRDPQGDGWHLLVTARANRGPGDDRGVIGHCTSPDLRTWTVQPPLSEPGAGFGQLEVLETSVVDGQHVLIFNCLGGDLAGWRAATGASGGVWYATAEGPLGPYDLAGARCLTGREAYVGRLVAERGTGRTLFLAFRHDGPDGSFLGGITDPRPVGWRDDRLAFLD